MSTAMELRYMEWIIKRVARLSLASRRWIMQRLVAVECKERVDIRREKARAI